MVGVDVEVTNVFETARTNCLTLTLFRSRKGEKEGIVLTSFSRNTFAKDISVRHWCQTLKIDKMCVLTKQN